VAPVAIKANDDAANLLRVESMRKHLQRRVNRQPGKFLEKVVANKADSVLQGVMQELLMLFGFLFMFSFRHVLKYRLWGGALVVVVEVDRLMVSFRFLVHSVRERQLVTISLRLKTTHESDRESLVRFLWMTLYSGDGASSFASAETEGETGINLAHSHSTPNLREDWDFPPHLDRGRIPIFVSEDQVVGET
jgi:hypothetical protein